MVAEAEGFLEGDGAPVFVGCGRGWLDGLLCRKAAAEVPEGIAKVEELAQRRDAASVFG